MGVQEERALGVLRLAILFLLLAVPASAQVIEQADPAFRFVLGPVLKGPSPWPWFDVTEVAVADLLNGPMTTPPTSVAGPGTLTATAPPNRILNGELTAEGTANNGIVWTGIGTNFTQADVGQRIAVNWDVDGNGSNQGRRIVYVAAVRSPTEIVASDYYMTEPPAQFSSARTWGRLGVDYYPWDANHPASQNVMFYEAGLAVGRLFAKTNLPKYQTQYHGLCTSWWRWGLGSGWAYPIARNAGLHTMLACATDPSYTEPPGLWDGLARLTMRIAGRVSTTAGSQVGYNPTSPVVKGTADVRELSYVLRYTALLAKTYGAHGGSTATWCGYLANQVTHLWLSTAVVPNGAPHQNYAFWEENLFLMNPGYVAASSPAGDPQGQFGTSPWRATGLPTLALIYAYEALNDPATCNTPSLAAQLFTPSGGLIAKAANFIWDYGRSADGGVFYNVGYESDSSRNTTVLSNNPAITLAVTNGSTQVVGTGTHFTTLFAGSTYIGILGRAEPDRYVHKVASVEDDTHLTLNRPYRGATESGLSFFGRALPASSTCGPRSIAKFCEPDLWSGRNLAADIGASAAWLYKQTGDPIWKARTAYFANKTFGGPATGAGGDGPPTGTCVGDLASECADGGTGNLAEVLPSCWVLPPIRPCGGAELNPKYGKSLGMAAGAGNTDAMIAYYVGGTVIPPPPVEPPSSDPCVLHPLVFRMNRWPAQATGNRRQDYYTSVEARVEFNPLTKPWTATATNAGGCVVTVRR